MKKFLLLFILFAWTANCSKDSDVATENLAVNSEQSISGQNSSNQSTGSEVEVNDFDGDGIEDNLDYYPYNPYKTIDDRGQIVDQYPSVYTASDITEINRKGLEDDLRLAADYFGKYEVEWWAVGREIDAMLDLASDWCDRRIERGQLWYYDEFKKDLVRLKSICMSQVAHPHASLEWNGNKNTGGTNFTSDLSSYEGWMEKYRKIGLNLPSGSANAGMVRNSGYTATQSSIPFQYDPITIPAGYEWISKEEHSIMVFHEYYHITQAQNVMAKEEIVDETGNTVRPEYGPTAFSEGPANYISQYLIRELSNNGTYKASSKANSNLKDLMRGDMERIQEMLKGCPDFKLEELNYGNPCDPYMFGQWAAAYLTNKVGNMYVFHDVFWPKINEMTFIGAFEDTFDMTYDELNSEFRDFLKLPIDEQLKVVPDINFSSN